MKMTLNYHILKKNGTYKNCGTENFHAKKPIQNNTFPINR